MRFILYVIAGLSGLLLALMSQTSYASVNVWYGSDVHELSLSDQCYFSLEIPVLKPAGSKMVPGIQSLNRSFRSSVSQTVADFAEATKEIDCFSGQYMDSVQYVMKYEVTSSLASPFNSIVTSFYSYNGGAHGYTGRSAVTYSASTGETYETLDSILPTGSLSKLKEMVEKKLIETYQLDPSFGWNDVKSSWKSLYDVQNFYLANEGLVIFFDPYAVNSYAAGPQDVTIYWYELESLGGLSKTDLGRYLEKNFTSQQ